MKRSTAKMSMFFTSAIVMIGALLCCTSAAVAGEDDWRFSITPYLWLPSVNTQLAVKDQPIDVQTTTEAQDILPKLDFALLVMGEAAKDKFGLVYDIEVLKVSDDGTVQINEPRHFDTTLTFAMGTLAGEYRVVDHPTFTLDVLAGAQAIYAKTSIEIDASSIAPERKGEQNKTWVDPIIGLKCHYRMGEKWSLNGYGDIGGFGVSSAFTYQVIGSVSYSFTEHLALQAGYRFFADNFESGAFKFDTKLYGPVVGLTFSF